MAASSRNFVAGLCLAALCACTAGTGEGHFQGAITLTRCARRDAPYHLDPTFFGADTFQNALQIQVQIGSDLQGVSDGIWIYVADAAAVRSALGTPIPLTTENGALVKATLYLNKTCPAEFWDLPVVLEARAGTITFDEIYVPSDPAAGTWVSATLRDVLWVGQGEDRSDLTGTFRFQFMRARPSQHFVYR